jgi:environmental stress-induced protein Ves
MQILSRADFRTQPWKNGGGVTHEIARVDRDGTLLWRLSIAEVASDGPFSAFGGLSRILTVINGAGLWLDTPRGRITARPLAPVSFSGDLPVDCRRIDGAVTDFNLIFDGNRLRARVEAMAGGRLCPPAPGRHQAILALGSGITVRDTVVPDGSVTLFDTASLTVPVACRALLVTLDPV